MLGPVKTHKVINILGILGICVSFVLTVTFNFVAGSGKSKFLLFVQDLIWHSLSWLFLCYNFVTAYQFCLCLTWLSTLLGDIFISTVGNISTKYELDITPSGFTLAIWSLIYIWIAIAIGFCKCYYYILCNVEITLRSLNIVICYRFILHIQWIRLYL